MKSSNDLPIEWVEKIFMRLHGRFGYGRGWLDNISLGLKSSDSEQ